jgi:hypothetical protein
MKREACSLLKEGSDPLWAFVLVEVLMPCKGSDPFFNRYKRNDRYHLDEPANAIIVARLTRDYRSTVRRENGRSRFLQARAWGAISCAFLDFMQQPCFVVDRKLSFIESVDSWILARPVRSSIA